MDLESTLIAFQTHICSAKKKKKEVNQQSSTTAGKLNKHSHYQRINTNKSSNEQQ